jgi:hypothetical protein
MRYMKTNLVYTFKAYLYLNGKRFRFLVTNTYWFALQYLKTNATLGPCMTHIL